MVGDRKKHDQYYRRLFYVPVCIEISDAVVNVVLTLVQCRHNI